MICLSPLLLLLKLNSLPITNTNNFDLSPFSHSFSGLLLKLNSLPITNTDNYNLSPFSQASCARALSSYVLFYGAQEKKSLLGSDVPQRRHKEGSEPVASERSLRVLLWGPGKEIAELKCSSESQRRLRTISVRALCCTLFYGAQEKKSLGPDVLLRHTEPVVSERCAACCSSGPRKRNRWAQMFL